MKNFGLIAKSPEVVGAVVSDFSGALLESSGNIDPEGTAAVLAYTSQALGQAGEQLGLGALTRAVVVGPGKTGIVTLLQDGVLGVYIDPTKSTANFEKKLDDLLQK